MPGAPGSRPLEGKAAVVTGAGRGIGRACTVELLERGARVVAMDLDGTALQDLALGLEGRADGLRVIQGDVADEPSVRRMISRCLDDFGAVDAVVANAGIVPSGSVLETTPAAWDEVMRVNGRGTYLTCRLAVEAMAQRGEGALVLVSSISGVAGQAGQAAYGPSKFLVSGLTKHLAVELAPQGIRVNAVAPGTILVEAVEALPADYLGDLRSRHPMGRLGRPSEVAAAVAFLVSDDASFITGAILPVDGGYLAQ